MAIFPYIVASLAAAIFVQAGHIEKRGTVGNSHIVGLAAAVPSGTTGTIYKTLSMVAYHIQEWTLRATPRLEPTGGSNSGCGSSIGQVYVRGATAGKHYGLMYIWYMPKDEPSFGLGHRHEWEGVIVWLSSSTATTATNIVAVCPSAHGGWNCNTTTGFFLSGTSPLIKYDSPWPINHQLFQTNMVGGKQPLVAWESMSLTVRSALEHAKFGVATVPFKDSTFEINLAKAKF
ncbi:npp1 domain-containing protein [Venturia nashicola]|uniref:Npp1 domain-containing protein n=2 Tax=Venturia nashicola TaxID=86259 RepID=A0A4Z1NG68_9PEZI|nr:npp1 domain-containing protein [Venturia nashicola]